MLKKIELSWGTNLKKIEKATPLLWYSIGTWLLLKRKMKVHMSKL